MARALEAVMAEFEQAGPGRGLAGEILGLRDQAYVTALRVTRQPELAEDAVQNAYLRALAVTRNARRPEEPRAWFLAMVVNCARDLLRSESRRKRRELAVEGVTQKAGEAPDELVALLRAELDRLEEHHRLPISLCYESGLSQREAAAVLGCPSGTVAANVSRGLERLRAALAKSGYTAAPAAVLGALAHTAPAMPAALAAAIAKLISDGVMVKGTGAAVASAAAKGGLAVKIIAGVVAAGVLAGAVAVVTGVGVGFKPAPATLSSPPPTAAPAEGKPAPINDYKGMQEREEVFEFAQKPAVTKEGDKTIITFASKGKCDATVTVLGPDGKVVRHLASGVLGKNAPWPFQQNSLAQKVEWDGLTDDFKKAPAGCKVKVGLGLKAAFEKSLVSNPYDFLPDDGGYHLEMVMGTGPEGHAYVMKRRGNPHVQVRAYDKDGKFVRMVWPPPAADIGKHFKLGTTTWGDKVPITDRYGTVPELGDKWVETAKAFLTKLGCKDANQVKDVKELAAANIKAQPGEGYTPGAASLFRLAVDPEREELYYYAGSRRLDGKTGQPDAKWPAKIDLGSESSFGADGLLYLRVGPFGYGRYVIRVDHDGKLVPFKNAMPLADTDKWFGGSSIPAAFRGQPVTGIWTGKRGCSNVHTRGLYVSPNGMIAVGNDEIDLAWAKENGIVPKDYKSPKGNTLSRSVHVAIWDADGKLLTASAVGETNTGHGVTIDRDGNVYAAFAFVLPEPTSKLDGITDVGPSAGTFGGHGSLVKFRWQGGKFPLGGLRQGKDAPAGAQKVMIGYAPGHGTGYFEGAQWVYGGLTGQHDGSNCTCHNTRFDMDRYARIWIPANQLDSIVVLDSNMNRIARLGRYGNSDDTEADLKDKKDGLRFAWSRCVTASDAALYVGDAGNQRILKAALTYAAEETVPAP